MPERSTKVATKSSSPAKPVANLINRELSWLDFNARVLELATDAKTPLLERVRFVSIFASNLDEFFMVRVAGLMEQAHAGLSVRSPDGRTPQEALVEVRQEIIKQLKRASTLLLKELAAELGNEGIKLAEIGDCTKRELSRLTSHFEREVYPVLTPLGIGPGHPFPYISGLSMSLGVFVRDPKTGEERLSRVKVPEGLPRFVEAGKSGRMVRLEDTIAHFLSWLFPGMEIVEHAVFRVTRDADFEVSDEADDLLEAMETELRQRRFGNVVRLEVDDAVSDRMLDRLKLGLRIGDDQVYRIRGPIDLSELGQIADLDRADLKFEPWVPVTQPRLARAEDSASLFAEIRRSPVLVHHPYDSFATSFERFVNGAAEDDAVTGLKTAVYRTSDDSLLMPALIDAAEAGKQSVCLVELKARFDERRNIEWSRAMEQSGVHVVYGFPDLKIHAKTTLVIRHEGDRLRRYVHVGTGNYNAATARLYEDFSVLTADAEIAADVADLFNYLTGFGRPQRFRKLLVAPFNLRERLIDEIREVAAAAKKKRRARIRMKLNALTDPQMVEELYRASQAGAEIAIVARSICALRPGIKKLSENIRVRSILGRFLEHSRIFCFEAHDKSTYMFGSADLMPRNLDRRIEIVAPIEDARIRRELDAHLDTLFADNSQAWELKADGSWRRAHPAKGEKRRESQSVMMRRAQKRANRGR